MSLSRFARLSAAVVSMGVLSSVSQAQPLTADTTTAWSPDGWVLNIDESFSQSFTGAGQLDLVTFRFIVLSGNTSSVNPIDVPFVLTEWPAGQSSGTALSSGVFSLPSGSSWTVSGGAIDYFDSTFDFGGLVIQPATTYAISLFGTPITDNYIGIGITNQSDNTLYADGSGYFNTLTFLSTPASWTSGNVQLAYDLAFSAIGSAAPVPEASSAAVLFTGMFVGGLMLRRRRRQPADAGLLASATQA